MGNIATYCEKIINRVSAWLNWVAVVTMGLMLLIVVIDVVGAKFFHLPLRGSLELASLLGLLIAALAIPFTYILKGHISIEFFMQRLRKSIRNPIIIMVYSFPWHYLSLLTWQMFTYSETIQGGRSNYSEYTDTGFTSSPMP